MRKGKITGGWKNWKREGRCKEEKKNGIRL
jgi:hypothetical protein